MCDDFHGTDEWNIFIAGMNRVFPDRPIVDIDNGSAIFHTIFDLDDRYQVPASSSFTRTAFMRRMDSILTGAAFMTTRAGSWWRSAMTWIWAIPGSTPTIPNIPRSILRSASASV
jgi:hypothetical protein